MYDFQIFLCTIPQNQMLPYIAKRTFQMWLNVSIWKGEITLDYRGGSKLNTRVFKSRELFLGPGTREMAAWKGSTHPRCLWRWWEGLPAKECRWSQEARKKENEFSLRAFREKFSAANNLWFSSVRPMSSFWPAEL